MYRLRLFPSSRQCAYQYGPCGHAVHESFPHRTYWRRSLTSRSERGSEPRRARARIINR